MSDTPGTDQDPRVPSFESESTSSFGEILHDLGGSLLVTTYQAGRLVAVRSIGGAVNTHFSMFEKPMGVAFDGDRLALGTRSQVWTFGNVPDLSGELFAELNAVGADRLEGDRAPDACFLPRTVQWTGDIAGHDIAWVKGSPWIVATRFSCLVTLDHNHSFVPQWKPRFISALAPEDRCHLNGLAVRAGLPTHVTALATTDTQEGWRPHRVDGGVLIQIKGSKVVGDGLCMPHSPRWHAGQLWLLESGTGALSLADLKRGRVHKVIQLPGFARGLCFAGRYAFVGLSKVRESATFGGLPVTEAGRERECGVWAIDLEAIRVAGFLRFRGDVEEIFDVAFLPGVRRPEFVDPASDLIHATFCVDL